MKRIIQLFFLITLLSSCAKIPVEAVDLTDAIIKEGDRMHTLNITLLNKMFKDKSDKIDDFIKTEYTPRFLENFMKKVPAGTDAKAELPNMLNAIVPEITSRRNQMQTTLEGQRIKLVTKLNDDYKTFSDAALALKKLIASAVKLNKEEHDLLNTIKGLTGIKLDFNQVESELDKFILKAGDASGTTVGSINELNDAINSIIKK